MDSGTKRAADVDGGRGRDKRQKASRDGISIHIAYLTTAASQTKKQWQVPRKSTHAHQSIQAGDSGIWATCNKGKERACVGELRDLFEEYAELLYGGGDGPSGARDDNGDPANRDNTDGIENEIDAEVAGMRQPAASTRLFTAIRVEVQCGMYRTGQ